MKSDLLQSLWLALGGLLHFVFLTKLFSLLPILGFPLVIVTPLLLVLVVMFIFFFSRELGIVLDAVIVKLWLLILVVFPLLANGAHLLLGYYELGELFRNAGLLVLQGGIFLSAILFALKISLRSLGWLLGAVLCLIGVSFLIGYFYPSVYLILRGHVYFGRSNLELDALEAFARQRATGIYFNPNAAGCAILFIHAAYLATVQKLNKSSWWHWIMSLLVIVLLFATGSRGCLVCIPLILLFNLVIMVNQQFRDGRQSVIFLRFRILMSFLALIFALLVGGASALGSLENSRLDSLVDRVLIFGSAEKIAQDGSIHHRITAQRKYLNFIKKNPLFGYGPTFIDDQRQYDNELLRSHTIFLETILQNGILHLLLLLAGIILLFKLDLNGDMGSIMSLILFALILAVLGLTNSSILGFRFFASTLGIVTGIAMRPEKLNDLGRIYPTR